MTNDKRWRRRFLWSASLLAVCLALIAVSLWDPMWVSAPRTAKTPPPVSWMLAARAGVLQLSNRYVAERQGWRAEGEWKLDRLTWTPRRAPVITLRILSGEGWHFYICLDLPLWIPTALTTFATFLSATMWLIGRRRRRRFRCVKCGYDRTGLTPGALCPECGEPERQRNLAPTPS